MSNLGEFYTAVDRCLEGGETIAVATIVRTKGSSPREVGAKMLVHADGATNGTVGGGCGEAEVFRAALDVLEDHEPRTVTVDLTEDIAMNTDGVCGGIMDIFVEPWSGTTAGRTADSPAEMSGTQALSREILAAVEAHRPVVTATVVARSSRAPATHGAKALIVDGDLRLNCLGWPAFEETLRREAAEVLAGGKPQVRSYSFGPQSSLAHAEAGQCSIFYELVLPRPTLIIVGAGHVAVPLAQVGKLLDFEVVVVDDRASFANASRFPDAGRIIVDDFESALESLEITPSTYVVLVTRGHVHDVRSLRRVVHQPAAYVGMIGSRRRVFAVFKLLHDEGVPIETLMRIRAPIGLDIQTETPGEIALSIGAEILKVRRGGGAASFSDQLREQYLYSLRKGAQDLDEAPGAVLSRA